jgi:hypothetical protein
MINNKFLHYLTLSAFQRDLEAGIIKNSSIAFIKSNSSIWSHGKYFYCSDEDFATVVKTITNRLEVIEGSGEGSIEFAVKALETSVNNKLGELEEGKTVAEMIADLQAEFDADVMADGYTTEVELGGMAKGTDIAGKTAVEVLDLILKPEYAPVFTDGTCSISCSGHNNNAVEEVGSSTPLESAYSSAGNTPHTAAGDSGSHLKYGGDPTVTIAVLSSSAGSNMTWGSTTTKPGNFVVRATRVYAAGTDVVETNKGTGTNKTASNYTTIMANASVNSNIDATKYTIKSITKTANHTIQYAYKIYASNSTAGSLNSLGLKTSVSNVEATLKGGAAGQLFAVPSTYTNVKIEEYNATLNSWTNTTTSWNLGTTTFDLPDGTSKTYTTYTRANVSGEDMKARISATVGN